MPAMAVFHEDGSIEEAIMDVTVWWPGSLEWYGIDATVRYAGAARYVGAQRAPGKAAAQAEREKVKRYGRDVLPLAFEAGGRLGPHSEATLQRLADAAVSSSGGYLTRKGLLSQWRRRLESSLLFAAADAVLCALGRSSRGAAVATRWGSTRPVPAPIVDAVDSHTATNCAGAGADCPDHSRASGADASTAVATAAAAGQVPATCADAPAFSSEVPGIQEAGPDSWGGPDDHDLEEGCVLEGLAALIAEDDEAALFLHAEGA